MAPRLAPPLVPPPPRPSATDGGKRAVHVRSGKHPARPATPEYPPAPPSSSSSLSHSWSRSSTSMLPAPCCTPPCSPPSCPPPGPAPAPAACPSGLGAVGAGLGLRVCWRPREELLGPALLWDACSAGGRQGWASEHSCNCMHVCVYVYVCVCARACVRACVRVSVWWEKPEPEVVQHLSAPCIVRSLALSPCAPRWGRRCL